MCDLLINAVRELKKGRPVIIVDEQTRENEGDLVVAAEVVNKYTINFLVKHSSGVICLATTEEQLKRLNLSKIVSSMHERDSLSTPFTVSCEAKYHIGTGISAVDRATSIRVIGNPKSTAKDIVVPGHIFPLSAHKEGLNGRMGHTEASIELCKLAGLWPAAAIVEIPDSNGKMLKGEDLEIFAKTYNIPLITINQIKEIVNGANKYFFKTAEAQLPTEYGKFNISIWKDIKTNSENIVLTMGEINGADNVPLRIHSQCLTGDVFHSLKCDCGDQLNLALNYIAQKGKGILIWLRQEGRGIGLTNKIKAYNLQDTLHLDTVEANLKLNLPVDCRTFKEINEIINYYKPKSLELLTNNPQKLAELQQELPSINILRKEIFGKKHKENQEYLKVKKTKLHHMLNLKD